MVGFFGKSNTQIWWKFCENYKFQGNIIIISEFLWRNETTKQFLQSIFGSYERESMFISPNKIFVGKFLENVPNNDVMAGKSIEKQIIVQRVY